jgi:ketosteroid isomerase-like protein
VRQANLLAHKDMPMRNCRIFIQSAATALMFGTLCCAALVGRAQDKDTLYTATHQELDVVKIVVAQENAWNNGDLDGFLSHYKDDPATQAILGGSVRGIPNIRSAFHINYPNREAMGMIAYSSVEARELGENYTLATGKYHLERSRKGGGSADGTFTEVMEKTARGWQIIFSETT